jgi:hypothetical protein
MSKWRENFEASNSVAILKDAIRDAKDDKYKDKIDKALSGTVAGKYKRRGKK